MNTTQKETLRDCFEGCMSLGYALAIIDITTAVAETDALKTWARWAREMEEEGSYTF